MATNARSPLPGTRADHPDAGDPENRTKSVIADTVLGYDPTRRVWLVEDECGDFFEVRESENETNVDDFNQPCWELVRKVECSHDDYTSGAGLARWINA